MDEDINTTDPLTRKRASNGLSTVGVYSAPPAQTSDKVAFMASASGAGTQLLLAWSNGDRGALEELLPVVYPELRRIGARYCRHA
jgi:hypothetical protein